MCRSNYVRIVCGRSRFMLVRAPVNGRGGKGVYSAAQSRRHCYAFCVCWSSGPDTREHKILCTTDAAPLLLSLSLSLPTTHTLYTMQLHVPSSARERDRERDLSQGHERNFSIRPVPLKTLTTAAFFTATETLSSPLAANK